MRKFGTLLLIIGILLIIGGVIGFFCISNPLLSNKLTTSILKLGDAFDLFSESSLIEKLKIFMAIYRVKLLLIGAGCSVVGILFQTRK